MPNLKLPPKRIKIPFKVAPWPGSPYEIWAKRFIFKNGWRVRFYLGDEDDCLQECAAAFAYCIKLYEHKVNNAKWFMSLYQRAVISRWNTCSLRDQEARTTPLEVVAVDEEPVSESPAISYLIARELLDVFRIISDAVPECREVIRKGNPIQESLHACSLDLLEG